MEKSFTRSSRQTIIYCYFVRNVNINVGVRFSEICVLDLAQLLPFGPVWGHLAFTGGDVIATWWLTYQILTKNRRDYLSLPFQCFHTYCHTVKTTTLLLFNHCWYVWKSAGIGSWCPSIIQFQSILKHPVRTAVNVGYTEFKWPELI